MRSRLSLPKSTFLRTDSLETAILRIRSLVNRERLIAPILIPSHESVGRVTTRPVYARYSVPNFDYATRSGIAVRAKNTEFACENSPLLLREGEDFAWVRTGEALPSGADAVIRLKRIIGHAPANGPDQVRIMSPAIPWQHVRRMGNDIMAAQLLFPGDHELSAYDVGTLLSGGIWEVSVWERVRLRLLPTGADTLDFHSRPFPMPGQTVETRSQIMAVLAQAMGTDVTRLMPIADDRKSLDQAVGEALNSVAHVIVVAAGQFSRGAEYAREYLESRGELMVRDAPLLPGCPRFASVAHNGKLVIGTGEYPTSSTICFEELVLPLLAWLSHKTLRRP